MKKFDEGKFTVRQTALREQVGVAQPTFDRIRKTTCVEGTDYTRRPAFHGGLMFTEDGARKMLAAFGKVAVVPAAEVTVVEPAETPEAPSILPPKSEMAATLPVSPTDGIEQITVLPTQWANDRLVKGKRGDGEPVRVRIRKGARKNVIAGMKIPCRMVETGLWECVRHPRYRGRM